MLSFSLILNNYFILKMTLLLAYGCTWHFYSISTVLATSFILFFKIINVTVAFPFQPISTQFHLLDIFITSISSLQRTQSQDRLQCCAHIVLFLQSFIWKLQANNFLWLVQADSSEFLVPPEIIWLLSQHPGRILVLTNSLEKSFNYSQGTQFKIWDMNTDQIKLDHASPLV